MKDVIISLLGNYNAVTYIDADGVEVIPNGLAGVDIPYVFAGLCFVVVLYCTMRIIATFLE